MIKEATSIEYVTRRMNELITENPSIPVRVKILTKVPDKRKPSGYRNDISYAIVKWVATPSEIGNGPLMLNIEAESCTYAELASNDLQFNLFPTK